MARSGEKRMGGSGVHDGLSCVEATMIGERLSVNRQMTIRSEFAGDTNHSDMKKPPEGGDGSAGGVVDLSRYRRQAMPQKQPVQHPKQDVLILLRKLAPGIDDVRLAGIFDRVAGAWASARGSSRTNPHAGD